MTRTIAGLSDRGSALRLRFAQAGQVAELQILDEWNELLHGAFAKLTAAHERAQELKRRAERLEQQVDGGHAMLLAASAAGRDAAGQMQVAADLAVTLADIVADIEQYLEAHDG